MAALFQGPLSKSEHWLKLVAQRDNGFHVPSPSTADLAPALAAALSAADGGSDFAVPGLRGISAAVQRPSAHDSALRFQKQPAGGYAFGSWPLEADDSRL